MPTLLTLPTELLTPILLHALDPLPTSLPTIRALSLTHPRLYTLTLSILKQTLSTYEAVGTNQLLPHPYSRKDENGEVVYQDFQGMKRGMERIVEWRWVRGRLPGVVGRMEGGVPVGGWLWERGGEGEHEQMGGLGLKDVGSGGDGPSEEVEKEVEVEVEVEVEKEEEEEEREARAKLTAWLLGGKHSA